VADPTPLQQKAIPSTGETLPVIGLGTWQSFDVGPSASELAAVTPVLREFAALGGRLIDSSPMYGRAQETVGRLIAATGVPKPAFIATKVWTSGRDAGIRQMRDAMKKLRVDVCDLMQVHNLLDVDTHLDTLAEWKREGLVRYVGITHYTGRGAEEIVRVLERRRDVDFVQINYSVAERDAERRLLPLCEERAIGVIANRPLAGGTAASRATRKALPDWAAEIGCDSWPQLLLKFVVSHPAITCAIPATSDVDHLRDNMQAARGPLPDHAMRQRIAAAMT
jgi:diketogulonate reductase-like aldo/keto reductase